jgi:hypothetical protein
MNFQAKAKIGERGCVSAPSLRVFELLKALSQPGRSRADTFLDRAHRGLAIQEFPKCMERKHLIDCIAPVHTRTHTGPVGVQLPRPEMTIYEKVPLLNSER